MSLRQLVAGLFVVAAVAAGAVSAPSRPSALARVAAQEPRGDVTLEADGAPIVDTVPTVTLPTTASTTVITTTTAVPPADPTLRPVTIPRNSYAPEAVTQIGSIEIPAIGVTRSMYHGVTLHNIDKGPSHWPGTAMPGKRGNTVVAGHRVTNGAPFRNLDRLVAGDEVIMTVDGARFVYHVVDSLVVTPSDTWIANQTGASTGTLYACHPPGSQAQRFVVRLVLADA